MQGTKTAEGFSRSEGWHPKEDDKTAEGWHLSLPLWVKAGTKKDDKRKWLLGETNGNGFRASLNSEGDTDEGNTDGDFRPARHMSDSVLVNRGHVGSGPRYDYSKANDNFDYWYPNLDTWSFRRSLSYWISVMFLEGRCCSISPFAWRLTLTLRRFNAVRRRGYLRLV
jgi:hypothetical protein